MVGVFVLGTFAFKLPVSVSLIAAAVVGAGVGGQGFPLRHFVEGTLGYLDVLLIIATAMIFMRMIQASGLLDTLAHHLITTFEHQPASLLVLMMLFAMSAGMITGSSTAAVLTTGAIVAPVFMNIGISRNKTGAIIAMAGILGMIAPPVNIPVMIIGGGVDMPYIGFALPLFFLTLPLAVIIVLFLGLRSARATQVDHSTLPPSYHRKYGWRLYSPLILLVVLIVAERAFPQHFPSLGMPLVFMICSLIAPFTGRRMNPLLIGRDAIKSALPVMAILAGVGVFLQIMTLTGGRGFIVSMLIGLPLVLLYLSIGISMPLFGAVSAYGSASILGVPFVLALLGTNEIIVASALSLVAAMGDLMPPTALAGLFAAKVVKQKNYTEILRHCLLPALLVVGGSLGYIATANFWEGFLFWKNRLALYGILFAVILVFAGIIYFIDRMWAKRAREGT
ncbi:TRAP transporter large permease subunit [Candidatus Bipolaricaulota bacterium]|nr:TRAP transporter large permease subunit [Candidatus Bipolaricaulota bacterium]